MAPNEPWLEWHYARRTLPGYAELDAAHHAMNFAAAAAENEPDEVKADDAVFQAYTRWHDAFVAWHALAKERIPR
jgi:hypothetical protein